MPSEIFLSLIEKRKYSPELEKCIRNTVDKLLSIKTSVHQPGILLGKIQGGKTNAFIGTIGLAFDKGYDFVIILTKGTKALARQTFERIANDFSDFVDNTVQIFDIMYLPNNLTGYERRQKIIFIAKKEKNNLLRIFTALEKTYPDLKTKKILIIDDEADFASIGFQKNKEEDLELKKIASLIDSLRNKFAQSDYLQVTATPYSLYLQPEEIAINDGLFKPIRPSFTVLVPAFPSYVGGKQYFSEYKDDNKISTYIYEEISIEELQVLRKEDRRAFKMEEVLTSSKIKSLRLAIMNFIIGGSIRRLQQRKAGKREVRYSFIIHTEVGKAKHSWQESIVNTFKENLLKILRTDSILLDNLIKNSYNDIAKSLQISHYEIPNIEDVKNEVITAIKDDYIMIAKVNSERDINELLDNVGQLKLRNPFNIFIGGQILDRGITIENLIGFYYGRNPKRFQQDTVLQHSRMYGNRNLEDLSVTRFYTTRDIYEAMYKINDFDNALWVAIEKGHDEGIIFIRKDLENKIVPCSPNKILISTITTLRPFKRLLPIGFQTGYKTRISRIIDQLDYNILSNQNIESEPFLIDYKEAQNIIDTIYQTYEFEEGYESNIDAFQSSLEYLSLNAGDFNKKGKIWLIVKRNRNIRRIDENGNPESAPDTPKGESGELRIAREIAMDIPALILLRENGKTELGWRDCPFWWPVLVVPKNTKTVIFATDTVDELDSL